MPFDLDKAAAAARCGKNEVRERIEFLTAKAAEACRVMVAHPGERVGVALLLNRKKGGRLIVCECLLLNLRHPSLDWSYCIGFQRDISAEVPIEVLLSSTSDAMYASLLYSRRCALERRRDVLLGVGSENVIRYLHLKAMDIFSLDIWRSLRSDVFLATDAGYELQRKASISIDRKPQGPPLAKISLRVKPEANSAANGATFASDLPRLLGQAGTLKGPLGISTQRTVKLSSPSGASTPSLTNSDDMVAYLKGIGLCQYVEPLLSRGFDDLETLFEMDTSMMKEVGMLPGHALKLQRRVQELKIALKVKHRAEEDVEARLCTTEPPAKRVHDLARASAVGSWQKIQAWGLKRFEDTVFCNFSKMLPEFGVNTHVSSNISSEVNDGKNILFTPELQSLFSQVLSCLCCLMGGSYTMVEVENLLMKTGVEHAKSDVLEVHFHAFEEALTDSLRSCLEESFNQEVEFTWRCACRLVRLTVFQGVQKDSHGNSTDSVSCGTSTTSASPGSVSTAA
eukprot:TRINITY_DN23033_c0_g1_i2.p1 TRINITY_DN23033_c0_g1~~TRINITY_DN23033_c0_g1_i2.p1  ORF type:complete len:511 (-),score=101.35 TRINITY_DN23033_c0_g1_i2:49-1581(-)